MSTVPRPARGSASAPLTRDAVDFETFVGRMAELVSLASRLCSGSPGMTWIHGPVGAGKSTLVRRFARLARAREVDVEIVDAQGHALTPLIRAIERARADVGPRGVVVLDRVGQSLRAYGPALVVSLAKEAERGPLAVVDRALPPAVARSIGLATVAVRDLPRDAAHGYLQLRGVPAAHRERVLAFARGRPLALAVAAHAQLERPDVAVVFERTSSVVDVLRARLLDGEDDPRRRRALEICALLRATTEEGLAVLLPGGDPHVTFQWLRGSGLVEAGPDGLAPDALARDVLVEGLRLHAPGELRALVGRAWTWFVERAHRATTDERLADEVGQLAFLARVEPGLRALADRACAGGTIGAARRADLARLAAVARRWEGDREGGAALVAPARLDRGAFEDAVRAALRAYFDDARLARSLLLLAPMVETRAADSADRVATLRLLLREAVDALRGTDEGDAQHQLLSSLYLTTSGANQADAASWMPYVTLRGHLAIGIERVAELLWTLDGGDAHR